MKKKKTTGEEFYFVLFFHRFQTTRSPVFFFYSFFTVAPGCEKKKNEQNCFSAGTRDLTPRRAAGRTCLHKMLLKLSDGNFCSVMSECIVAQQIIIHFTAV